MTYREALNSSLNEIDETNFIPMSLPHFVMNIGTMNAVQILMRNPDISGMEMVRKMNPLNLDLDSLSLGASTWLFISWLLNQPIQENEEEDAPMWYDIEVLQELCNDFIKERQGK